MNFSQMFLVMPTSLASEKYTKIPNVQVSDTRGDAMKNYIWLKKNLHVYNEFLFAFHLHIRTFIHPLIFAS